ncbi:hypothetical protein COLO4_36194 [Corchorus olitorius]|uniref:Uncharacterized protein n=1 Tax=Corchorus olitorius TaxID=93759 RepID=A0A1R3GAP3_9ROSI|nr:hypothetical protein COLO4_36194 [Corchorus olitorius]
MIMFHLKHIQFKVSRRNIIGHCNVQNTLTLSNVYTFHNVHWWQCNLNWFQAFILYIKTQQFGARNNPQIKLSIAGNRILKTYRFLQIEADPRCTPRINLR